MAHFPSRHQPVRWRRSANHFSARGEHNAVSGEWRQCAAGPEPVSPTAQLIHVRRVASRADAIGRGYACSYGRHSMARKGRLEIETCTGSCSAPASALWTRVAKSASVARQGSDGDRRPAACFLTCLGRARALRPLSEPLRNVSGSPLFMGAASEFGRSLAAWAERRRRSPGSCVGTAPRMIRVSTAPENWPLCAG